MPGSEHWRVLVSLKEWALARGVHPVTAYRWYREGRLAVPVRRAGHVFLVDPVPVPTVSGRVVGYARVSWAERRVELQRRVGWVVLGATGRGLWVEQVVVRDERASAQAHRDCVGPGG